MTGDNEKYWYNLKTGEVEKGYESPAIDRAGPFETPEEAARAPEIMRERSRASSHWVDDSEAMPCGDQTAVSRSAIHCRCAASMCPILSVY